MLGYGCDEVSIMPVVCPHGAVSVSSLSSFSSIGSSYKPSFPSLHLYIVERHIGEYFKKNIRERKNSLSHRRRITGRVAEEANECDSPREVGCWFGGVDPHGISI